MVEETLGSVDRITTQEHPVDRTKPLPQILDKIEENITLVAQAASKAEEAAKSARKVAESATRAFSEAEKRVEEARKAGEKAVEDATRAAAEAVAKAEEAIKTELLQRIEMLEKGLKNIEDTVPNQKMIILREITRKEAKQEIEILFKKGYTLFYSDIAEQLSIDIQLVVEICNDLQQSGEIEVVDDTVRKR